MPEVTQLVSGRAGIPAQFWLQSLLSTLLSSGGLPSLPSMPAESPEGRRGVFMWWRKLLTLLAISSVTLTKFLNCPEPHSGDFIWARGLILVGPG